MKLENLPNTKKGNNWTEVIFKCPRENWVQILRDFFSHVETQRECLIPHYMIRRFEQASDSLFIELRVLRKQEHEEIVKSKVIESIKDHNFQIDPEEGDSFYPYHQWIKKGATSQKWTRERCLILSKTSKFVLEIINSNTTKEDKEEWTHLFSNMMTVFDILKIYHCPETVINPERNPYKVLKYF